MLSIVFSILIHGAYDFIATYEYIQYAWAFVAFVAVIFAVALILVRHMSSHDKYINNYNSFWR